MGVARKKNELLVLQTNGECVKVKRNTTCHLESLLPIATTVIIAFLSDQGGMRSDHGRFAHRTNWNLKKTQTLKRSMRLIS